MAIDTGALKKFVETFGPAVEAIPAVLEATANKDALGREIKKQEKELEKAKAAVAQTYSEADAYAGHAKVQAEAMLAERTKVQNEIAADKREAATKAREAEAKAKEKLALAEGKVADAEARLKTVDKELKARLAEADKQYAVKVEALEEQIKDLEKRHASAEKALATLLKKLGG